VIGDIEPADGVTARAGAHTSEVILAAESPVRDLLQGQLPGGRAAYLIDHARIRTIARGHFSELAHLSLSTVSTELVGRDIHCTGD
jgi:hypothetical protein